MFSFRIGEELEKYWKMTEEEMSRKRPSGRNSGGRNNYNKKRNPNTRYGNRKRSRDNNDNREKKQSEEANTPSGEHVRFDNDGGEAKKAKVEVKPEVKTEE